MNSRSRPRSHSEQRRRTAGVLGTIALALLAGAPARALPDEPVAAPAGYVIIVSAEVPVTNLTLGEAARLLQGERRFWRAGMPVVVLLPPAGSPARRFLLEHVFHMTEPVYRRHTLELLYRGEMDYAPKVVNSFDELIAFTAASHGAISIVPATQTLPATVRALQIDGRTPGAAGYALGH